MPEDEPFGSKAEGGTSTWEEPAYRLVFVGTGVFFLAGAVSGAGNLFFYLVFYPLLRGTEMMPYTLSTFLRGDGVRQVVALALRLLVGFYLFLRAPRLARWCTGRANKEQASEPV